MQRRNFIRIAGGGVIASAVALPLGGCMLASDYPDEAVQAWRDAGRDAADVRRWILSYAILAPHSHNLQSWRVDLSRPDEITLYCDLSRLLPQTDPLFRQIMMSHGTFLELLDLAARRKGLRADIELFPEGEFGPAALDGRPVARVRLQRDARVAADPLFEQVLARHTNREAYELRRPAADALRAIAASTAPWGFRAGFTGASPGRGACNASAPSPRQAWRIELVTPRTILESYRVLRDRPARDRAAS